MAYSINDWGLGKFEKAGRYATWETSDRAYRVIYIKAHGQGWTLEKRDEEGKHRFFRTVRGQWGWLDRKTAIKKATEYINKH